jgi:hypothetical protein
MDDPPDTRTMTALVAAPTSVFGKHRSISLFDPDGNKIQLSDGLD